MSKQLRTNRMRNANKMSRQTKRRNNREQFIVNNREQFIVNNREECIVRASSCRGWLTTVTSVATTTPVSTELNDQWLSWQYAH